MPLRRTLPTLILLTSALITACGALPSPQASTNQPGKVAPRYGYVASVPLLPGDSPASVQRALGGVVITWDASGCAAGFAEHCTALLGFDGITAQRLRALAVGTGRSVYIEPNKDVFSGGGTITATIGGARSLWAGGNISAWAGGARSLWAGGTFSLLPQNTTLWTNVKLQQAQSRAPNLGAGVTVAIIDTGIDLNHPAFQGTLTDPSTWYDFYAADAVPQDEGTLGVGGYGHGSNVAGIVLQIAPKAKIMPLRVLGPDGSGDVATVAQAITWAVSKGANVINLSLGSKDDSVVVNDAIHKAMDKGVLVTASAGNDNQEKITYPAAQAGTPAFQASISVGSVNLQDQKSSFSNYGHQLEIVAPGENVYAPAPGNLMAAWSGTSMAAPMAAGAFALALGQTLSSQPAPGPASPGPAQPGTTGSLPTQLINTSVNIYTGDLNKAYKDKLGKGRLDLNAFLNAVVK